MLLHFINSSNTNKMSDVITSVKPLFYVSKIFGQANYKILGQPRNRVFTTDKKWRTYTIFLILCMFPSLFFSNNLIQLEKTTKEKVMITSYIVLHSVLNNLLLAKHILQINQIKEILKKICDVDKKFNRIGIFFDYKRDRKTVYICISLHLSISALLYMSFLFFEKQNNFGFVIYMTYILFRKNFTQIFLLQTDVLMIFLKNRFDKLRENLEDSDSISIKRKIKDSAMIHHELYSIAKLINGFFSKLLLLITMTTLFSLVLSFFDALDSENENKNPYMCVLAIFFVLTTWTSTVYIIGAAANAVSCVIIYSKCVKHPFSH